MLYEVITTFANNINTHEGGTHLIGFKAALTRTMNTYATTNNLLKNVKATISGDDLREGMAAVISVKVPEPHRITSYNVCYTKLLRPKPIYFTGTKEGVDIEIAIQYNDSYDEKIFSFANNINTHEGGTHMIGFKAALTRTMNNYATTNNLLKNVKASISGDDLREGMAAVISVSYNFV